MPPTSDGSKQLQQLLLQLSQNNVGGKKHVKHQLIADQNSSISYYSETTTSSLAKTDSNNTNNNHDIAYQSTNDMSSSLAIVDESLLPDPTQTQKDTNHISNDLPSSTKTPAVVSNSLNMDISTNTTISNHNEPDENEYGENVWFQVVQKTLLPPKEESNNNDTKQIVTEEVIALYKTKQEANDCIQLKSKHASENTSLTLITKIMD